MEYIKTAYTPKFVYYPACGADYLPKEVFGANNVIHLSLPENEKTEQYLRRLGDGIKLMGEMEKSPLADESVDLIWLCLGGGVIKKEVLTDFLRVLKKDGLIAIEESQHVDSFRYKWQELVDCFSGMEKMTIPDKFAIPEQVLTIFEESDPDNRYTGVVVDTKEKLMDKVIESHGKFAGREYLMDYALFRKR